jgi:UDP-N-acetylglucosamine--N-acetylmuramyl-(pentapeptide) pyrophosphoryl-undecaprenol N-acetylglucosamine transferase
VTLRVLLAGGGTAGHTSPLIATADALTRLSGDVSITALGTERGLEVRVIPRAGYVLELIPAVPLPRRPSRDVAGGARQALRRGRATLAVFDKVKPHIVVGFGGYVSMPAYLAAKRRRVPLVIHEQNALPGIANKAGARLARRVATSFPDTPLPKAEYVGLPIRSMISTLDRQTMRAPALRVVRAAPGPADPAGDRGIPGCQAPQPGRVRRAGALAAAGIQVLHIAGPQEQVRVTLPETAPPYVVIPYVQRMDLAYAAADLTVCRCGASAVTEAAAVGLPAVFVPLPIGNGEQALNARAVVDAGGGLLVDDAAMTPDYVRATVPACCTTPPAWRA